MPRSTIGELQEQVKQAKASFDVSAATIRQREADLRLAQTNLDRSRSLYERELIPKQTFDDTDSRYQAATAQLDLARAQFAQTQARLDELKINLSNTIITSPVSGFVAKRVLDPGGWVTPNTAFISVVDIGVVRLVANIVEKDIRRITQDLPASVEVDAYPGEKFTGRVAHISPVLDPATRTGQIEIDIANPDFRLKPGMYAKVSFTVDKKENALVIPTAALVDLGGNRGVFLANQGELGQVASFKKVDIGIVNQTLAEVTSGLSEGENIVTTGAGALREGDRIFFPAKRPIPLVRRAVADKGAPPGDEDRVARAVVAGVRAAAGSSERGAADPDVALLIADRFLIAACDVRPTRASRGARMSIPRFAIQRPVMMSMICAIIILLGGISLTRLPVDLLPDIAQPTISVRVNYTGVGPLEMEELVTRPLEQQLSAVSGVAR